MQKVKNIIKNNIIFILILSIILALQIVEIVYSTSKRNYYHIDEFYSHGLIQYKNAFIYENEDFVNNWHSKEYYKEYLTINENQKFDFTPVYNNQINDVHPPFWYLLLRIACSFNIGEFSIWPGTILNIIIFIFSFITTYLIGKEVFNNKYYAILLCCFYGFSLASIETVMYVRMYQLFILNILILIYWHLRKRKKENLIVKDLIPLYFMIIIGFLTHYYYSIFVVILYLLYIKCYIKDKKYDNMIKYTLTIVFSVLTSIIIFPYSIKHIFFSYRGHETLENVKYVFEVLIRLFENIKIIDTDFFNGFLLIIFIIIALLFFINLFILKKRKIEKNTAIKYVTIPMIIYLIITSIVSPYYDLRYLMPIIPLVFCTLLYLIHFLLSNILNEKITIYIILAGISIFSLLTIPKLTDNTYTFTRYTDVKERIEKYAIDKPCIYIYSDIGPQYNKMMETYQALTTIKETYILSNDIVTCDKINDILKYKDTKDGVVIIMHYLDTEKYVNMFEDNKLFNEATRICTMNRFDVILFK